MKVTNKTRHSSLTSIYVHMIFRSFYLNSVIDL